MTYDLDTLLRLAEGEAFDKASVRHIDWDRAMAWEVGQRDPVGTKTGADAEAQLVETQTFYNELARYEYVEKLVQNASTKPSRRRSCCWSERAKRGAASKNLLKTPSSSLHQFLPTRWRRGNRRDIQ